MFRFSQEIPFQYRESCFHYRDPVLIAGISLLVPCSTLCGIASKQYVCLFTILNIDAVLGFIHKGKLTFTRCNRKVNNNKISKCPAEVPIRHNQHALDSDRCNMLLSFLLLTISSSQLPGIKYRIQIQILQLVLDYTDISNQSLRGLEIKNIVLILQPTTVQCTPMSYMKKIANVHTLNFLFQKVSYKYKELNIVHRRLDSVILEISFP